MESLRCSRQTFQIVFFSTSSLSGAQTSLYKTRMFNSKWNFIYNLMLLNAYVFISCLVVRVLRAVLKGHFGDPLLMFGARLVRWGQQSQRLVDTWKFNKPSVLGLSRVEICVVLCSAAPNCYQNTALPGLGVIFSTYGENHAGKASRKEAAGTFSGSSCCSGPNAFYSKNDG